MSLAGNPSRSRAMILQQQGRYADAEREWRNTLASEPNDAMAHAMLSLCLAERQQLDEATREASQAVGLAPDHAMAHYVLAKVQYDRNRYEDALRAINQAIALDPHDADYYSLLAAIHFEQRRWEPALSAAEQGLAVDPDHTGCTNLRAMALVKLGRREEAAATIGESLQKDPDNALTHANQGWALLHAGEHRKAQEHFREALRIDPTLEWAKAGVVESLKARNPLYRWLLRYFLWMASLNGRAQWGFIIGAWLLSRILRGAAKTNPDLQPLVYPVLGLYVGFVLLTWLGYPFFNLLLRLNRFGRLALSRDQILGSNWLAGLLLLSLLTVGSAFLFDLKGLIVLALASAMMTVPTSAIFLCDRGWPRRTMSGIAIALGAFALMAVLLADAEQETGLHGLGVGAFILFGLGFFISLLTANYLQSVTPEK